MKKIVFLTGTRADYGKLKSLLSISQKNKSFEVHIFITGMHMNPLYGYTADEIVKSGFKNLSGGFFANISNGNKKIYNKINILIKYFLSLFLKHFNIYNILIFMI